MARAGCAVRLDSGKWAVYSSRGDGTSYVVDLAAGTCTCPDHLFSGSICQHLAAARLAQAWMTTGSI